MRTGEKGLARRVVDAIGLAVLVTGLAGSGMYLYVQDAIDRMHDERASSKPESSG